MLDSSASPRHGVKKPRERGCLNGFQRSGSGDDVWRTPAPWPARMAPVTSRPASHGREPGLKRRPPAPAASACAVQRSTRMHCCSMSRADERHDGAASTPARAAALAAVSSKVGCARGGLRSLLSNVMPVVGGPAMTRTCQFDGSCVTRPRWRVWCLCATPLRPCAGRPVAIVLIANCARPVLAQCQNFLNPMPIRRGYNTRWFTRFESASALSLRSL